MKRTLVYASVLILVLLALWAWMSRRMPNPPPPVVGGIPAADNRAEPPQHTSTPPPPEEGDGITHMGTYYPPPPDGFPNPKGIPPSYLTWEQMVNPTHGPLRSYTREEIEAKLKKGVRARFTLRVMDSMRAPVPDVDVEVRFAATPDNSTTHKAVSDGEGLCSFEGVTMGHVVLKASKAGYYTTEHPHHFLVTTPAWNCVKDGKWQPWDATLELVLKEMRSPAALYANQRRIVFPQQGIPYGFDCVVGDLVEPDGAGKIADLIFTCNSEEQGPLGFNRELRVETVNGGGLLRGRRDKWSKLQSPYTVPETGHEPQMIYRIIQTPNQRENSKLTNDEYLLFETCSRGTQPCVGKIYGGYTSMSFGTPFDDPTKTKGFAHFVYYFNPILGDRSIEFDPKRNLFTRDSNDHSVGVNEL